MSVLEIKLVRSVSQVVALGGKEYGVVFDRNPPIDGEPAALTITGLEDYEEAKRFLGCIAAGLASGEKTDAASPPAPPEALRPLSDAEMKAVKPVSEEAVRAALEQGAKDREAAVTGAPQSAPKNGGLPAKLVQAERLKDVLSYLAETGVKGEEKVIAECERLKDEVPALKRIPNLAERVKRALVMLDYSAGS